MPHMHLAHVPGHVGWRPRDVEALLDASCVNSIDVIRVMPKCDRLRDLPITLVGFNNCPFPTRDTRVESNGAGGPCRYLPPPSSSAMRSRKAFSEESMSAL
jgi:hypothetical protein